MTSLTGTEYVVLPSVTIRVGVPSEMLTPVTLPSCVVFVVVVLPDESVIGQEAAQIGMPFEDNAE